MEKNIAIYLRILITYSHSSKIRTKVDIKFSKQFLTLAVIYLMLIHYNAQFVTLFMINLNNFKIVIIFYLRNKTIDNNFKIIVCLKGIKALL